MGGFSGHDKASTAVSRVEPHRGGGRGTGCAVEMNSGPQLHERRSSCNLRGIFIVDTDEGDAQVLLLHAHGAYRHRVAVLRLANGLPLRSGAQREAHDRERRKHDGSGDQDGSFDRGSEHLRTTISSKADIVSMASGVRVVWRHVGLGCEIMETLRCTVFGSVVGPLFLAASERGLVCLEFDARLPGQHTIRPNPRDLRSENARAYSGKRPKNAIEFVEADDQMQSYTGELDEYFAGERKQFTFSLDLRGTDFQRDCWQALLEIPYGETRTYADIARAVGKPHGFRAVGMANNRNPIAIVVPCHRVIASDGTLCGYGGGLEIKRKLLQLEGALSGTLAT